VPAKRPHCEKAGDAVDRSETAVRLCGDADRLQQDVGRDSRKEFARQGRISRTRFRYVDQVDGMERMRGASGVTSLRGGELVLMSRLPPQY